MEPIMPPSEIKNRQVKVTEDDRQVVLHPENDDLFVQTGKQVIDACRLNISIELWIHELTALSAHVQEWARARSSRIASIYLAPRPNKLVLFVCPASKEFDFDLADEMAQLNTALTKNFNVGTVEILQVPAEELDRFVDGGGGKAKLLYGRQAESHQPVEA
ncbi:MAG TPA: hypothetical protein VLI90_09365 [Tepidisphaeraceae bacterium]|nr:hypothetical protein [Tepidisphaeraceae bacterium]